MTDSDSGAGSDTTEVDVPAIDPSLPVFVTAWGSRGTEPGQFVEPSSVELDAAGDVYVAGHEDRVQKFTRDGTLIAIFGQEGVGPGDFDHPHGLTMDRDQGLLYVGDQENGRVQVLTIDGDFVRQWSDPQFAHIHDVGIDPLTGDIFVGDLVSNVVQRFTDTGEFVLEFGVSGSGPGQFSGVWGMSTDSKGLVYVADSGNGRVQVFTPEGTYLNEWTGFTKPTGVFVDALDQVHICDSLADEIVVFSGDGQQLETWDLEAIVGTPSEPEDIVISPDGVHIYIGDVLNHRAIYLIRE